MTKNRISLEGIDIRNLTRKLERYGEIGQQEMQKALLQSALMIEADAIQMLQQGFPSGRIYQRGSVTHRASAPGQPPATDTGALVNSITWEKIDDRQVNVVAGRGKVNYADDLEFGTAKMEARPFMKPAYDMNKRKIRVRFGEAVHRASNRVAKGV